VSWLPNPSLSVILPVYNEGEAVEPVLRALSEAVTTPHELVVVYDFDEDTTVPVVHRLEGEIPQLRGLRNDLGRGVLNAMKAGIAGTSTPYVLISMADGSDDPAAVDAMVELARSGADVVSASRYMKGGAFLDSISIESTAGFELALELTVKATLAKRRVAEIPTTWRDRTAGQSNFKLREWLPHYLHWYRVAFLRR
jgi:glycosyltransferase involved in cell wall biosynthesis